MNTPLAQALDAIMKDTDAKLASLMRYRQPLPISKDDEQTIKMLRVDVIDAFCDARERMEAGQ